MTYQETGDDLENPFLKFPYDISGPVKSIVESFTDVRSLWSLSITCKVCHTLFWDTELYYRLLVEKCRKQPWILRKLVLRHYPEHNHLINIDFIKDIVRANGNAIFSIPFVLWRWENENQPVLLKPLITKDVVELAMKEKPSLYEALSRHPTDLPNERYRHFNISKEYFDKYREDILGIESTMCINDKPLNMRICHCANCQYNLRFSQNLGVSPFLENYDLGLTAVQRNGYMLFKLPSHHRTKEMLIAAVKNNGLILRNIFEPWRTNQFYIPFINGMADNITDEIWIEICHYAVQNNAQSLNYVPQRYKTEEIMRCALSSNTYVGNYLTNEFRTSHEKMISCIKKNLRAFDSADISLRNNIQFVNETSEIIKRFDGEKHRILNLCGDSIKSNRALVFKIFKTNPMEYKYLPQNMKEEISIYNYAMKHWSRAYQYSPYEFQKDFNITREAVIKDAKNLSHASYKISSNQLLLTLALQSDSLEDRLRTIFIEKLNESKRS